jgi:hypothetical protein
MKKFALSALMMLSLLGQSQAASLYSSNLGNGLTLQGGASAVTTGTIRFGVFPAGFDFDANSENPAAMDAAFTQVHQYTGPITANALNGFFDLSATYSTTGSFEGTPYDSSPGTTTDVAGDIAGEKVYVWVLNNVNPAVATQQAIFSTSQRWADADDLVPDTFVNPDSGALELAAHLGELANGSNIGAGANSHTTGGALIPVSGVIATIAPNATQFLVGTSVTFTATVTEGTPPLDYQWRRNGQDIPNAKNPTYTISSVGLAGRGDYDCVVTNTANSSDSNDIFLNVVTAKPTITTPPAPAILPTGGTLNLAVQAVGAGTLNYSWKKGAVIAGAVTNMLSVPNLKLTDAGAYAVTVTNAPGAGTGSVSATANVIIVDQTERTVVGQFGKVAALDAVYAGAGALTFEWFLSNDLVNPLEDGVKYAGSKTKKLTIKNLALTDSLGYVCRVSAGAAGSQTTGVQTLVVYNAAPTLAAIAFPPAIVGGFYSFQIPTTVLPDGSNMAESFAAAPLPAGLKLDVKAGTISGYPTKAGTSSVKVTAANKVGKSETPAPFPTLVVNAFPLNIAGSYVGPVERLSELGADLGGRVELVVSATGVVSGKLILGAATLPVAGPLTITGTDPLTATAAANLTVVRKGMTPLTLSFDLAGNLLANGNITDGDEDVFFKGWRNTWLLKPATADASDFAANYNIAIGLEEGDPNIGVATIPQGYGYASAPVKLDGKVAFTGKFADNVGVTGSTFIGPNGEFFMFQMLYANKGSFLADVQIAKGADEALATDNSLTGDASWSAPVNNAAANKLYKAGFNFELVLAGGAYVPPTTILGLAANDTADLSFEEANVAAGQNPDTTVTILAANKFTVGAVPAKTALTFTPASGIFGGSFESVAKKKTSFFGMIVPVQGQLTGLGYFLLDQAGTPATQQSGAVYFEEPSLD